ncbi:MAG: GTP-binding protein [Gammaproteobacteria bacterium]|nr:GTP-binding protein [Gammaproteobacteria bacterium]
MLETVTNPELKTGVRYASPHVIGDRRQEVVFIGQNLEPEQTREILDRCLLSDEGMAVGPAVRGTLDEPFPRWFAEKNED